MQTIAHPCSCLYSIAVAALLFRNKSFLLPISCCERNANHLRKKLAYLEGLLAFACLAVFQVFLWLCQGRSKKGISAVQVIELTWMYLGWGGMKKTRFSWIKEGNKGRGMASAGERAYWSEQWPPCWGASAVRCPRVVRATRVATVMPQGEYRWRWPPPRDASRVFATLQTLGWQNAFVPGRREAQPKAAAGLQKLLHV